MNSPLSRLGFGRSAALPAVHITAATRPTITPTSCTIPHPPPRRFTSLFVFSSKYSCTRRVILSPATRANFDTFLPYSDEYENRRDTEKNIVKRLSVAASSIVFACVIGVVGLGFGANIAMCAPNQALATAPGTKSKPSDVGGLSGQFAVKSLMEVSNYLSTDEGTFWGSRRLGSLWQKKSGLDPNTSPTNKDVIELKREAMQKLKLGKSQDAEKLLLDQYERWKDYSESAFFIEMALVEILISQGKYKQAYGRGCLNQTDVPSDPRIPLYKAIIYTVDEGLQNMEKAEFYWAEFQKTIGAEAGRTSSLIDD